MAREQIGALAYSIFANEPGNRSSTRNNMTTPLITGKHGKNVEFH
jgi:hypothetical protein